MDRLRRQQARLLLRDRRAHVTFVLLLTAFLVLGVFLWPANARITALQVDNEKVHLVDSEHGGPIFEIDNIRPGQEGEGEVAITNEGIVPSSLSLTTTRVDDAPGPNGGDLSEVLDLVVLDITDPSSPRSVFKGDFTEGRSIDLGSLGAKASRRFRFVVEFPDGGLPPSATTGDNAFMGSTMEVDFTWTANGDEIPLPAPQAQPEAGPVLELPLATSPSSTRPARECLSRRNFTIRVREPRGDRLRSATVVVNGRRLKVRRVRGRLSARVDLRGVRKATVRVQIVARSRAGRRLSGSRTYNTCTAKTVGKRKPTL
jgi:hypothetical protein